MANDSSHVPRRVYAKVEVTIGVYYRGRPVSHRATHHLRFPMPHDAIVAATDGLQEAIAEVKRKCARIDEKHPSRRRTAR